MLYLSVRFSAYRYCTRYVRMIALCFTTIQRYEPAHRLSEKCVLSLICYSDQVKGQNLSARAPCVSKLQVPAERIAESLWMIRTVQRPQED